MSFARITLRSLSSVRPTFAVSKQPAYRLHRANFSDAAGLKKEDVQTRVIRVLKSFERIDPAKLSPAASFAGDLALDSLDAVEVVMAVEEACKPSWYLLIFPLQEFGIEIPDAEADEIKTVQQAIDYVAKTPEG
ncbi:acyl carrier protein [Melanogaster broomeanus]|nr:acyl carrier protein [Melanogaster broomeanus]